MPAIVTIRPIPEALAVIQTVQLLGARYEQARADNTMFVYEDDTLPPREGTTPHAYARSLDGFLLHAQRYVIASNYIPLAVALEGATITEEEDF